jgi:hypothetical protein
LDQFNRQRLVLGHGRPQARQEGQRQGMQEQRRHECHQHRAITVQAIAECHIERKRCSGHESFS